MHQEVLTQEQLELLPLIKSFSREFYLVGGTAVALHIGHRRSIDFDLFTEKNLKRRTIKRVIDNSGFPVLDILYEDHEQMHLVVNNVKITFFKFHTRIPTPVNFDNIIKMPELLELAAMKAYALGGRAKRKDHFSLQDISGKAKEIFKEFFNEKLFREQLSYFKDVDHSESLEYLGNEIKDEDIKFFLTEKATESYI